MIPNSVLETIKELAKKKVGEPWSFERWDEVLAPAKEKDFTGMVGAALRRRFEWLERARANGWTPEQADAEWEKEVTESAKRIRELSHDMARQTSKPAVKPGTRKDIEEAEL